MQKRTAHSESSAFFFIFPGPTVIPGLLSYGPTVIPGLSRNLYTRCP